MTDADRPSGLPAMAEPPLIRQAGAYPEWAPATGKLPARGGRRRAFSGAVVAVALIVLTVAAIAVAGPHRIAGHAVAAPDGARQVAADPGTSGQAAPRAVPRLADNALLATGVTLGPASCSLPDLGRAPAQLEAFYRALLDCLEQSWRPALDKAGEPMVAVTLSLNLPTHSACGDAPSKNEAVAYYCGGDTTIYAPTEWMLADANLNRARHIATIAHEYGHHVQRQSGILAAAAARMSSPNQDTAADKEQVRRIELQANCFGALFVAAASGKGSITASLANAGVADYGRAQDSDTHGTRKHQLAWAKAGFEGRTTAACNTWSASAAEVS
ncbi:neutral zinc metallopeptidase [Amycolatopsis sp. NPDC059027]|uniref:neutral zinc metallopeptidase n=1 Tax=unclassified Amycolatopsis TaxID=2618356 RepID=UPI00366F6DD1